MRGSIDVMTMGVSQNAIMPLMSPLPLVLSQIVISTVVPAIAISTLPDSNASLTAAPLPSLDKVTLMSPSPAARACFSISFCSTATCSGKYERPNCWTMRTSRVSCADAGAAAALSAAASITKNRNLIRSMGCLLVANNYINFAAAGPLTGTSIRSSPKIRLPL